jgi:hypothetical protein
MRRPCCTLQCACKSDRSPDSTVLRLKDPSFPGLALRSPRSVIHSGWSPG